MPPKPRPAPKPKTSPKARVLYDYQAGDNDEITLAEGEQVEVSFVTINEDYVTVEFHYTGLLFTMVFSKIQCNGIFA